jgi:hypothetical protein
MVMARYFSTVIVLPAPDKATGVPRAGKIANRCRKRTYDRADRRRAPFPGGNLRDSMQNASRLARRARHLRAVAVVCDGLPD